MQTKENSQISQEFGLGEQVEAVLESLPWPAIALDERGLVAFVNEHAAARQSPHTGHVAGQPLAALFPQYAQALRGSAPWVESQEVEVSRESDHGPVHERVYLRQIPGGSYLVILDETAPYETERDRAQTARLASIGFMLAGVCHEVSNPLAATYSMVQLMQSQEELSETALREGLDRISVNVKRILEVSRRINEFCRIGQRDRVPIDDAVDEALTLIRQDRRYQEVEVEHLRDSSARVRGDAGHLRQIVYNIVLNAAQAMNGRGRVLIRAHCAADGASTLTIEDNGPGIAPDHIEDLFTPFFTTKPSGEGTGLGLAITRDLVREHGGEITAANRIEGGARFEIIFPGEKSD